MTCWTMHQTAPTVMIATLASAPMLPLDTTAPIGALKTSAIESALAAACR